MGELDQQIETTREQAQAAGGDDATRESLQMRVRYLDTYRNKGGYRSVFTGLVSVPRRTPWMSEKNDSLDALMREMGDEAPG